MARRKPTLELPVKGGFRLSRLVELKSARFLNITAGTTFLPEKPTGATRTLHAIVRWEARSVPTNLPDHLVVHVVGHFGVVEDPSKQPVKPGAEMHLTLELVYELPANAQATEEEKKEFAKLNGLFNAWPFLRAELFGLLPRLGLPPYVLPVHRVYPPMGAVPADREEPDQPAKNREPATAKTH